MFHKSWFTVFLYASRNVVILLLYTYGTKVQKELERQLEQENEDLKVRDEMGGIEYEQGGGPPMREIDEGSHPDDENVVYENFAAEPEPVHPNQAWKDLNSKKLQLHLMPDNLMPKAENMLTNKLYNL